MGHRHRARERALQCLYEWETTGRPLEELFARFWSARPEPDPVVAFAERLVRGTVARVEEIDPLIGAQADNWRFDRMGRVDRNILRLGVYELTEDETPVAVVIDEAIELAKRFSGEQAGQFVNGVLDGINRRLVGEGGPSETARGGPAGEIAGRASMEDRYDPTRVEARWQARWEEDGLYRARVDWDRPKHYALTMLPYPSGDLHIGHWFAMTPADARARFMRMRGYNVLFPMGFDAFGLPAENAAFQRGVHPWKWTYANIEKMRRQLRTMGAMFDWKREAVSCTPEFYRWTEWFFKQFFDNDLAYRGEALVNWSDSLQTVLANEQVIDGKDERTGQPVAQKMMSQWFFRITRYADELLELQGLDWPEPVFKSQQNWIDRSEGARVTFRTEGGEPIKVFTTRPDTLWGATFMVLAPEHDLVAKVTTDQCRGEVEAYVAEAAATTEIERTAENRAKTGVFTGGYAINPVTEERIPIWIADYVMVTYGSGAIMAVPAHDERDFDFARRYGLEVRPVIQPDGATLDGDMAEAYAGTGTMAQCGPFDGTRCTDAKGRANPAIAAVIDWLEEHDLGSESVNYRLRDWLISRQRYWGAPIPVLRRQDGEYEAVEEADLPVRLPEDVEFMPTGQSPLKEHEAFRSAEASDGQSAERETDTMDTFVCSSWYQYRYLSPGYEAGPFDPEEAAYWLPVDTYTGGAEHATLHLLYTRFFTKAMRDLGIFDQTANAMRAHGRDPDALFDEPMLQLRNQGQVLGEERAGDRIVVHGEWQGRILLADSICVLEAEGRTAEDAAVVGEIWRRTENVLTVAAEDGTSVTVEVAGGTVIDIPGVEGCNTVAQLKHHLEAQRMSKSKGNVVSPDQWVSRYGADAVRAYLMFGFDWLKGGPWDSSGIQGVVRWLDDVWEIALARPQGEGDSETNERVGRRLHQTIDRVRQGLEKFSFNTAIAALMALRNDLRRALRTKELGSTAWAEAVEVMLRLMAPFTPHVTEELYERIGGGYSIHQQPWPEFDAERAAEDLMTLVVLVNGKVRDRVEVPSRIEEADATRLGLETEGARRYLEGAEPRRTIFIPARNGQEPKLNIVL